MYAIYNVTHGVLSLHNTLKDALKEYAAVKEYIVENDPTGDEQVMLLELKKFAEIFVDENRKINWREND